MTAPTAGGSGPGPAASVHEPAAGRWRARGRAVLLRLAALAVGLALAAVLAEVLVLLVAGEQPKFPRRVVEAPWGLRYNEPGARYRHKSADVSVRFRINGQGMRADRDFARAKPDGVRRVVVLGDSYTIGYEVEEEETFARVMERELARAGVPVEILNAGVSGFSAAEEVLYLERELLDYDPDLVVIAFSGNDLVDNLRTGLFALDDEGALAEQAERYVPAGGLGNFLNSNGLFNLLSERSNAFVFVKEQATLIVKGGMVRRNEANLRDAQDAQDGEEGGGGEETEPAAGAADGAFTPEYERRLLVAIYERLHATLTSRGIPLVVLSIPTPGPDGSLTDLFPLAEFDPQRPGSAYLSARSVLEPFRDRELLYWTRSHGHWTPFSHARAGEALARLVLERGFLPGGAPGPPP